MVIDDTGNVSENYFKILAYSLPKSIQTIDLTAVLANKSIEEIVKITKLFSARGFTLIHGKDLSIKAQRTEDLLEVRELSPSEPKEFDNLARLESTHWKGISNPTFKHPFWHRKTEAVTRTQTEDLPCYIRTTDGLLKV